MKTAGQLAYEADLQRVPLYHDGTPRHAWDKLDSVAQWSWERNPAYRNETRVLTESK